MINKPQVYLDSSDFSLLSDPRRLDDVTHKLLEKLQYYADHSLVQFRFSMAHVCEVAPTGGHAQEAAQRRAEMIYRLCGTNSLVTIEEIVEAEATGVEGFLPYSDGRWYPCLDELLPESPLGDMKCAMDEMLRDQGLNRQQRRQRKREVFNRKGFKEAARKIVATCLPDTISELLTIFPFEHGEIDALIDFFRTGQRRDQAMNACHRVLANPIWIMKHFARAPDKLDGVTEWLRKGGTDFAEKLGSSTSMAQDMLRTFTSRDIANEVTIETIQSPALKAQLAATHAAGKQSRQALIADSWGKMESAILMQICTRVAERKGINSSKNSYSLSVQCPGISTAIAVGMHAARQAAVETNPRPLKASDFGDAMHGIYAPYVDIFRTDAFMADTVARAVKSRGTRVARRLSEVPTLIEEFFRSAVVLRI